MTEFSTIAKDGNFRYFKPMIFHVVYFEFLLVHRVFHKSLIKRS